MKTSFKKITAFLAVIMIISVLSVFMPIINVSASENLGTITECRIDRSTDKIMISGSIKHSVLVSNRNSTIAVYRIDPWTNITNAVKTATPLATMSMTIRFEFAIPCTSISHRLSMYAVALIDDSGAVSLISDPQYLDFKSSDTSKAGYKSVITDDVAGSSASQPGNAIIDIYLDKLDKGNKSGYIFNADGELFYFDRDVIKDLDKKVRSYTASGSQVYFRFLISPYVNDLSFCTKGNLWATNKCIVVNNRQALNAIYAHTYFLVSRYNGTEYGKVSGIILGKGADVPVLYNYASLSSQNYEEVYARSLVLVGMAALDAAGDSNIALVVPVGDTLSENGSVFAVDFLSAVANYLKMYSDLSFTVMCESRHNPFKLSDSYFAPEDLPDDTVNEDTNAGYVTDTYEIVTDIVVSDTVTSEVEENTSDFEETSFFDNDIVTDIFGDIESTLPIGENTVIDDSLYPETDINLSPEVSAEKILEENTAADGYYCTDNIEIFLKALKKLQKDHISINDGFAWCWYPGADTVEGALGVCYAYNYMKLASVGADFYAVCFENESKDRFSSIAHLFKYIDTQDNIKETEYARDVLGIENWSDIISGFTSGTGVFNNIYEIPLQANVNEYIGSLVYFDYSFGKGTGGWVDGIYCNIPGIQTESGESFLQAEMNLEAASGNYAELIYLFDTPEPLLLGDALTFEIKCGEDDGSLYEIGIYICCGNSAVLSKTVVSGGTKVALSANVSEHDKTEEVSSIKIILKRVTGSGKCKLNLYRVLVNSISVPDDILVKDYENIREYLRSENNISNNMKNQKALLGIVILFSLGIITILIAYGSDRKRKYLNDSEKSSNNTR